MGGGGGDVPSLQQRAREPFVRHGEAERLCKPLEEEELEPVTLLPGRRRAITADLTAALDAFEMQLDSLGSLPSSHGQPPPPLPKAGGFPILRRIYKEHGLATVMEKIPLELGRDLFQFIIGICWELYFRSSNMERRVGVIFLVYMFYSAQDREHHSVPVDIATLDALADLREECEKREVLLECPQIIHRLVSEGAVSLGLRRSYGNLQFDRAGRVTERLAAPRESLSSSCGLQEASEASDPGGLQQSERQRGSHGHGRGAQGAQGGVPVRGQQGGVPVRRLQVKSPSSPAAAQAVSASSTALATREEVAGPEISLEEVLKEAAAYDSEPGPLVLGPSPPMSPQLEDIAEKAQSYAGQTHPPPRDIVLQGGEGLESPPLPPAGTRLRPQRKRCLVVESSSGAESEDSLVQQLGGFPQDRPPSGVERPLVLRSKGARQSQLLGLQRVVQRRQAAGPATLQGTVMEEAGTAATAGLADPQATGSRTEAQHSKEQRLPALSVAQGEALGEDTVEVPEQASPEAELPESQATSSESSGQGQPDSESNSSSSSGASTAAGMQLDQGDCQSQSLREEEEEGGARLGGSFDEGAEQSPAEESESTGPAPWADEGSPGSQEQTPQLKLQLSHGTVALAPASAPAPALAPAPAPLPASAHGATQQLGQHRQGSTMAALACRQDRPGSTPQASGTPAEESSDGDDVSMGDAEMSED